MKGGKEEGRVLGVCLLISYGIARYSMEWYACNGCGKRARSASSFLPIFFMISVWILLLGLLVSMNPCVVAGKEGREGRKEGGFDPFFRFHLFLLSIQHLLFVLSYFGIVPVLVALRERAL
ncbi:hypothetical protein B9Z19DRAFT_1079867 [Tuber borchii]|uniref:Uncharacterized protein n=1 Tax=Tuber borchii TaxID=42251 RepID=A0A2T6ZXW6_TUBBO|nr:hypothetical protein B9Z19DRAFT_1079867 [Tuber borchii]